MKCPHCLIEVNPSFKEYSLGHNNKQLASVLYMNCPNEKCNDFIIDIAYRKIYDPEEYQLLVSLPDVMQDFDIHAIVYRQTIFPTISPRPPAPSEVDKHIAQDYNEACMVLSLSPKASAALSRRCLQNILREKAGATHHHLAKAIEYVISDNKIPAILAHSIDAIRHIGNFAAHPSKDTSTGEIVDVEPEEAEWLLDILVDLFEFHYVQPEKTKKKRDALNAKLKSLDEAPMK